MEKSIRRSECLYNGQIIGIESIFSVVNGKQINIKDKVEALRKLGQEGLLECTCGCGTKLTLVAGDRNLRQQHFRVKEGHGVCALKKEGDNSINSKIVLKCWLDDKINQAIQTRVPVCTISNSDRKYTVSHFVPSKHFALNYTDHRSNIEDEKLEVLTDVFGTNIIHIVDMSNIDTFGQYPEYMNKIQKLQGFCLFLSVNQCNYDEAKLQVSYYTKDENGTYERIDVLNGLLKNFSFSEDNKLVFNGETVLKQCERRRNEHEKDPEGKRPSKEQPFDKFRRIQELQEAGCLTIDQIWKPNYKYFVVQNMLENKFMLIRGVKGKLIRHETQGKPHYQGRYSNRTKSGVFKYSALYPVWDDNIPVWLLIKAGEM